MNDYDADAYAKWDPLLASNIQLVSALII